MWIIIQVSLLVGWVFQRRRSLLGGRHIYFQTVPLMFSERGENTGGGEEKVVYDTYSAKCCVPYVH